MTVRIVEFDPAHCKDAKAHLSQAHYQHLLDNPSGFRDAWPNTFSALADGELIAIGGTVVVKNKLGGWVFFCDTIQPRHFLTIHRTVVLFLSHSRRTVASVFAHVDPENTVAARWAKLLGLDARRTDFFPDGTRMLRFENHVQ